MTTDTTIDGSSDDDDFVKNMDEPHDVELELDELTAEQHLMDVLLLAQDADLKSATGHKAGVMLLVKLGEELPAFINPKTMKKARKLLKGSEQKPKRPKWVPLHFEKPEPDEVGRHLSEDVGIDFDGGFPEHGDHPPQDNVNWTLAWENRDD